MPLQPLRRLALRTSRHPLPASRAADTIGLRRRNGRSFRGHLALFSFPDPFAGLPGPRLGDRCAAPRGRLLVRTPRCRPALVPFALLAPRLHPGAALYVAPVAGPSARYHGALRTRCPLRTGGLRHAMLLAEVHMHARRQLFLAPSLHSAVACWTLDGSHPGIHFGHLPQSCQGHAFLTFPRFSRTFTEGS